MIQQKTGALHRGAGFLIQLAFDNTHALPSPLFVHERKSLREAECLGFTACPLDTMTRADPFERIQIVAAVVSEYGLFKRITTNHFYSMNMKIPLESTQ